MKLSRQFTRSRCAAPRVMTRITVSVSSAGLAHAHGAPASPAHALGDQTFSPCAYRKFPAPRKPFGFGRNQRLVRPPCHCLRIVEVTDLAGAPFSLWRNDLTTLSSMMAQYSSAPCTGSGRNRRTSMRPTLIESSHSAVRAHVTIRRGCRGADIGLPLQGIGLDEISRHCRHAKPQ